MSDISCPPTPEPEPEDSNMMICQASPCKSNDKENYEVKYICQFHKQFYIDSVIT